MDVLALLGEGFAGALTWQNLIWVLVGCVLGTAVGVMPGLGSSMAVALLLPVTFSLALGAALIWLVAGVATGVVSALRRGSIFDRAAMGIALAGRARRTRAIAMSGIRITPI